MDRLVGQRTQGAPRVHVELPLALFWIVCVGRCQCSSLHAARPSPSPTVPRCTRPNSDDDDDDVRRTHRRTSAEAGHQPPTSIGQHPPDRRRTILLFLQRGRNIECAIRHLAPLAEHGLCPNHLTSERASYSSIHSAPRTSLSLHQQVSVRPSHLTPSTHRLSKIK